MMQRWSDTASNVPAVDTTNRNTALASAFVEELARCGLRHAVVAPGSRSTPLAVALWRQPAIDVTVLVDERSAGFFALGAAQATRRPVAVLCTSGTAAANLHPAVAEADESAVPLLILTADRPPELRGIGAGQTIDQLKLYGDAVRWFCEVGTHAADDDGLIHMRATGCRAYAAARGEPRPGPVHLNLAWREPLAPMAIEGQVTATSELALKGRGERPLTAVTGPTSAPDDALLDGLAERIAGAPRGLILAGRQLEGALAPRLAALAAATGYPLLAEPTSQVRLGSHDRDLVVATYDAIARLAPEVLAPEVVIRFGEMPTSKALRLWIASLEDCAQIVIDPAYGWNEPSLRAEAIVRAEAIAVAHGLSQRLGYRHRDPAWAEAWLGAGRAAADAIRLELESQSALSEPGIHIGLGGAYRDGDLVYTASSMPIRDQEAFLPSLDADVLFLCNRGANGIDGLVSSGIGAAHASGRAAVIVTGDLGLLHDLGGLAALNETDARVRIVVIENGGGRIFDLLPQAEAMPRVEFEDLMTTPRELDLSKVADLFGVRHLLAQDAGALREGLESGSVLIEASVDPDPDREPRRRLGEAVEGAVRSALPA
jgi:2-succinyl-5-enolpyruvyl-6-hydroxy-3-cyclohexene-1-carboxylate synthase